MDISLASLEGEGGGQGRSGFVAAGVTCYCFVDAQKGMSLNTYDGESQ